MLAFGDRKGSWLQWLQSMYAGILLYKGCWLQKLPIKYVTIK